MSQEYSDGGYEDPTENMDPEEYALLCQYVQYLNDNDGYDENDYLGELLQQRNRTKSRAPPPQRAPPPLYPAEEDNESDDEDEEG